MATLDDRLDRLTHKLIHNGQADGLASSSGVYQPITLGYSSPGSGVNQGSITTEVALTGMSVTVTVPAGRRIKITAKGGYSSTIANDSAVSLIKEGSTNLAFQEYSVNTSYATQYHVETVITPSAGTHTYNVASLRGSGTGVLTHWSATNNPAFILVEDITGTSQAYPSASVPVGLLAQTYVTTPTGAMADLAVMPGVSVNVAIPAGRTLKVTLHGQAHTSASAGWIVYCRMDGNVVGRFATYMTDAAEYVMIDGSHIISPAAGAHTFDVQVDLFTGSGTTDWDAAATIPIFLIVEDITPTPATSTGAPSSTLSYVEVLASQTGITTETDIIGLAATVTVPAGRRLRISAFVWETRTVADGYNFLRIKEGSTVLQIDVKRPGTTDSVSAEVSVVVSPSAGTHTYKLSLARTTGTGTVSMDAGATFPAFILVEDITGSIWPTGSAVTAGMIAPEPWTDFTPTLVVGVAVTFTKTYARYQRIGRTIRAQVVLAITSTGTASNPVRIGIPVPAVETIPNVHPVGTFWYQDTGTALYTGVAMLESSTTTAGQAHNTGAYIGQAPAYTVVSGDIVGYDITYEAAA